MKRRDFIVRSIAGLAACSALGKWFGLDAWLQKFLSPAEAGTAAENCYRLVVLGDPHLPVRERERPQPEKQQQVLAAKAGLMEDIHSWTDVNEVSVVGDLAAQFGKASEYQFARDYLSELAPQLSVITGNHDFIYEDEFSAKGHFVKGSRELRKQKLEAFKENFQLESLYYTHMAGTFRLIYLSADSLDSPYLTEISSVQLQWFSSLLAENKTVPVLVFFHAPLAGTLPDYNRYVNTPDFIAQPAEKITALLQENPQVKLWVSGHTHTPAINPGYADLKINRHLSGCLNIHNADLDRTEIWTNSLYLYPDKIVVKTFNHKSKSWMEHLERTIPI